MQKWAFLHSCSPYQITVGAGFILYVLTVWINPGFIALDDYSSLTSFYIPVQNQTIAEIIANSEIRSPLPRLILFGVARVFYFLGANSPMLQYQLVLTVIAISSFTLLMTFSALLFEDRQRLTLSLLLGFFFLCPLLLTRSMIEPLSAPFLFGSAVLTCLYDRNPKKTTLALALLLLCIASIMRFQTGICGLAILATVFRREKKHLLHFVIVSAALFLVTGWLDQAMRGRFHHSLFAYVDYNLKHSSSYGTTPFYTYGLLLIGATLPPTFFARFKNLDWRKTYRPLFPLFWFFVIFVVSHSMVPHKEERFMIPVLPLLLALLTPLLLYFWKEKTWWRLIYFAGLNSFLLFATTTSTPQRAALKTMVYLDNHSEFKKVDEIHHSIVPYLSAFLSRDVTRRQLSFADFAALPTPSCDTLYVIRTDWLSQAPRLANEFTRLVEFTPAWPEALVIRLNPHRNSRRGALSLYQPKHCPAL